MIIVPIGESQSHLERFVLISFPEALNFQHQITCLASLLHAHVELGVVLMPISLDRSGQPRRAASRNELTHPLFSLPCPFKAEH